MKTRWIDKNVNLDALSKLIAEFYYSRGFKTRIDASQDQFTIVSVITVEDIQASSIVKIVGKSGDFIVEFVGDKGGRFSTYFSPLITMFGGGIFILRRLKLHEFYENLEKDFWVFVEEAVEKSSTS